MNNLQHLQCLPCYGIPKCDRKKLDLVIIASEKHCAGAVKITYERYVFNRRVQESGEHFKTFLCEIQWLAWSCEFAVIKELIIWDRIVIRIRDEMAGHRLLQVCDLSPWKVTDICKASKAASRQLKEIAGAGTSPAVIKTTWSPRSWQAWSTQADSQYRWQRRRRKYCRWRQRGIHKINASDCSQHQPPYQLNCNHIWLCLMNWQLAADLSSKTIVSLSPMQLVTTS